MIEVRPKAVVFDVDGVLVDSLGSHLQICEDLRKEFNLDISIPDADGFRTLVQGGVLVSPMVEFFRAVGFPGKLAVIADEYYQENFMSRYSPSAFDGCSELLERLAINKLPLGIVTSNVRANVVTALGNSVSLLRPDCFFTKDLQPEITKTEALHQIAASLDLEPSELVYIGDQPKDYESAHTAGCGFIGVSYGWGIEYDDKRFPVATSIYEVGEIILNN